MCLVDFSATDPMPDTPPTPPVKPVVRKNIVHSGELLESLGLLREQELFTDAVVLSEDNAFHTQVHKVVLAGASAYFKSILMNPQQSSYFVVPGETVR